MDSNFTGVPQLTHTKNYKPIPAHLHRLSFLLNAEELDLENSLKLAPDLKLVRLLSFKYRQQLFRKRKWASILSTVVSVYGLLIAFLIAEIEIRCLEGESGSSLEHQYACSVDEIPGMESSNTSHQAHQFCSGDNSTVKLKVLVDNCRAYGVMDKLQCVEKC